jgi:hypothetical protein
MASLCAQPALRIPTACDNVILLRAWSAEATEAKLVEEIGPRAGPR